MQITSPRYNPVDIYFTFFLIFKFIYIYMIVCILHTHTYAYIKLYKLFTTYSFYC